VAIVVSGIWVLFAILWDASINRGDRHDPVCFADTFSAPTPSGTPVSIGTTDEQLQLNFGGSRGAQRDELRLTPPVTPPSQLEVQPSALTGDAGTIPAEQVHVRATGLRDTLLVDVCLDIRTVGRIHSGSYSGVVVFTDPRVTELTIPLGVNIQGRYLYYLAPLVLLLPLLGLLIVWTTTTPASEATFGRGALTTFIAAVAATGTVFGAQGISNPAWGGGLLAAGGLVASMYTAAIGVTATLGGAAGQVKADNP